MKKGLIIVCLTICIIMISYNAFADSKVVVFVADGMDLLEIEESDTAYFNKVFKEGASALLTTRTAGALSSENMYLTLGSGARARTSLAGALSFNALEQYKGVKARDIYQRRTGKKIDSGLVSLEQAFLKQHNLASQYGSEIGFLGSELEEMGFATTVLGNSDIWQKSRRQVALIGFNQQGYINQGDIGQKMSLKNDQYPSGYLTNKGYLIEEFNNYLPTSDLIIIESGDTSRIEAVDDLLAREQFKTAKKEAISRVDNLLGMVYNNFDFEKDYLVVVSPKPSKASMSRGNRLGFIVIVGPGMEGALFSTSTRRKALVNNLDFAPAIISFLASKDQLNKENPLSAKELTTNQISFLTEMKELVKKTFSWRPRLIKGFISMQILILVLACIYLINNNSKLNRIIAYFSLLLLWVPLFFLLSSFFISSNILIFILGLSISSLCLVITLLKFNLSKFALILPSFLLVLLLGLDLILNLNLIQTSIFGYSPVIAARFYGIGNEYMGFLVGASTICFFLLIELLNDKFKLDKKIIISGYLLFSFFVLFLLGHPQLGANFGGFLTMLAVILLILFYLLDYKLDAANILKLFGLALCLLIIFLLFNYSDSLAERSHIGESLVSVIEDGPDELLSIISRKLAMNLKLFQWTIWTRILLAFIIFLIAILKHPVPKIDKIVDQYSYLSKGIYALLLSSIVAILINDSGVVAAATLLFYPIFTLLYLHIELNQ